MSPSEQAAPPGREPASHGSRAHRARGSALAWGAVVLACAAAGVWLLAVPPRSTLALGAAPLAYLDTVALGGRIVTAEMDGTVSAVGSDGQIWVGTADHAFEVRGAERDSLTVEDRVLVAGRIREDDGQRWLDAQTVTPVVGVTLGTVRRSGERPTVQPED